MKKLSLIVLSLCISRLEANDSVASLSGRGLILEKSASIRMKKEFLHITPKMVKVDYVYLNDGPTDIETTVAFPHEEQRENPYSPGDYSQPHFNDFKVVVNGKTIQPQLKVIVKYKHK